MRQVPLHGANAHGRVALVDDADYGLVSQYRWTVKEFKRGRGRNDGPYAITNVPRGDGSYWRVCMHVLLTGWRETDHDDHDGLNNQRNNLRDVKHPQNVWNQRKRAHATSSQYKGVSWKVRNVKWAAYITVAGTQRHLGLFTAEEAAAHAYDDAARLAFGEWAALNFPRAGERSAL